MTSRVEAVAASSKRLAAARIKAGEWPWSFFCWPEERPAAGVPVGVQAARARGGGDRVGACGALPGVRQGVGESRLAGARRRAVRATIARWGWWSTCSTDDAAATRRGVPRRALLRSRSTRAGSSSASPLESFPPARDRAVRRHADTFGTAMSVARIRNRCVELRSSSCTALTSPTTGRAPTRGSSRSSAAS